MKRWTVYLLIILSSIIFIENCVVNPVTGRKELMLISQSDEISMGKNLDKGLKVEIGVYNSLNLNAYVRRIGNRLTPHTHRPNLKYHFAVLDTPVVNAFAAPGGYIYITRGLLALLKNEAELAVVLGHELGHVNARHSAKAMTKQILFGLGLAIGAELSEKFRKYAPVAVVAGQLLFLKYSRDNEYQADALGVEYSRKGGYNPGAMIGFFKSLLRIEKKAKTVHIPNFLSTHPLTNKRILKVKESLLPKDRNGIINTNSYLYKIDNLVYGKDPRQGYVRNGYFYHPQMRFKFKMPSRWNIKNTPQKLILTSSDGKGIIILSAEELINTIDEYSERTMSKLSNPQVLSWNRGYINGFNALYKSVLMLADKQNGDKDDVRVDMTFIRKGKMVYTFLSMALNNDFYGYNSLFNSTVMSFSNLRDYRYINVKPLRLKIRRVNRRQRLRDFLSFNGVNRKYYKKISDINGVGLDGFLNRGRLLKILIK